MYKKIKVNFFFEKANKGW